MSGDWIYLGLFERMGTTNQRGYYEFWDYNLPVGSYEYRYKQIDSNGNFSYSQSLEIDIFPPDEFVLYQNYPNPFNPSTTIRYGIPTEGKVRLEIYDVIGQLIEVLVDTEQKAGNYEINFTNPKLSSGVYFYRLQAEDFVSVKKMLLAK